MIHIEILGARGSVPVSGENYIKFGGATSCVRVFSDEDGEQKDNEIYLDAGTGIVSAVPFPESKVHILMSHMHLDHLTGLPFFSGLFDSTRSVRIYAKPRGGLSVKEAAEKLFTPPFWPCGLTSFPADVRLKDMPDSMDIGSLHIETMEITHPGGATAFKITSNDKKFVYASDFEHSKVSLKRLFDWARGADLILYDGQYTTEEYEKFRGFGHSVPEIGLEMAQKADIKQLMITHHAPGHDDTFLSEWEERLAGTDVACSFAKEGYKTEI